MESVRADGAVSDDFLTFVQLEMRCQVWDEFGALPCWPQQ